MWKEEVRNTTLEWPIQVFPFGSRVHDDTTRTHSQSIVTIFLIPPLTLHRKSLNAQSTIQHPSKKKKYKYLRII